MIITIAAMGTVIVGLVHLNIKTNKRLKQEENEHLQVMESFCILAVKYFIATNNKKGIEEAKKRGLDIEAIKKQEVKIKVFKNE